MSAEFAHNMVSVKKQMLKRQANKQKKKVMKSEALIYGTFKKKIFLMLFDDV